MQSVENSQAFGRLLSEIENYIQESPYRNYSSFGKKASIEKSRMSRILNRKYVPSIREIRNILDVVGKSPDSIDYIRELHPETFSDFMSSLGETSPWSSAPKKLEELLCDEITSRIFLMATSRAGTTRDEIRNEFGSHGVGIIENFIAQGFLGDENGVIKGSQEKYSYTPRTGKMLIGHLSRIYDSSKFGNGEEENFMGLLSESISNEARSEVYRVLRQAFVDAREIILDPANHGEEKVWMSMMMDDYKMPKDIN